MCILGVLLLVFVWHFFSSDVSVWINEEQITGPMASLAGGGISLIAAAMLVCIAFAVMFLFAGIGLFVLALFVAVVFPWLFPLFVPVLLVIACIWFVRSRQKKAQEAELTSV